MINKLWKEHLAFKLTNTRNCDLNRLNFYNCPPTDVIKSPHSNLKIAKERFKNTETIALLFSTILEEHGSETHLYNLYYSAVNYLKWVDLKGLESFSKFSVEDYLHQLLKRAYRREIKNTTYAKIRSHLHSLFMVLDIPSHYFNSTLSLPKNDGIPFEAYSRSDLNKMLPILRAVFKQSADIFLENPDKYRYANKSRIYTSIEFAGKKYGAPSLITKMMVSAAYLLSFYTFANSSILLSINRPEKVKFGSKDVWYTMPAFKRRAFKVVHVEIAEHDMLIPKYSISFFNKLLDVSKEIDPSENALLLQTSVSGFIKPLTQHDLTNFNRGWMLKNFDLRDDRKRPLFPLVSRFRKTGSELSNRYQGPIAQGDFLNNSPKVREKHYTSGNEYENMSMLMDVALIREQQARNKSDTASAKKDLNIKTLSIEEYYKSKLNFQVTASGGRCKEPFIKNPRQLYKNTRIVSSKGENRLACTDIQNCFGCENQVIVQSVDDIWCLLSFKESIEESEYLHLDHSHFKRNYSETIKYIEDKIIPNIKRQS